MTNLDREFIRWFYEDIYPELGSNRAQAQSMGMIAPINVRDYWMREAYLAGAKTMAQDVLNTLLEWATHCEGLDPELLAPSEVYDRCRENMHVYLTKVLDNAKH